MAHHPGRALLDSRNSPLANAVQSLDVARLRELIADGADANTRIGPKSALHELCSTPDVAPLENYVHKFPQFPAAVHPRIVGYWAHVGDY